MPCHGDYEYDFDDDPADVWEEGSRRAGKEHRCCECDAVIGKGERHDYLTTLVRGDGWSTLRRCLACSTLADLVNTISGFCPRWTQLADAADEAGIDFGEWHAKARSAA